jgi:hypothetical protein
LVTADGVFVNKIVGLPVKDGCCVKNSVGEMVVGFISVGESVYNIAGSRVIRSAVYTIVGSTVGSKTDDVIGESEM